MQSASNYWEINICFSHSSTEITIYGSRYKSFYLFILYRFVFFLFNHIEYNLYDAKVSCAI